LLQPYEEQCGMSAGMSWMDSLITIIKRLVLIASLIPNGYK